MASTYQPLLDSQKVTIFSCKTLCFVISLFAVIFSAVFLLPNLTKTSHSNLSIPPYICNKAHDLDGCLKMVSEVVSDEVTESNGVTLLQTSLLKYVKHMDNAVNFVNLAKNRINDNEQAALADCLEQIELSIDRVTDSIMALANRTIMSHNDAHAWLSSVLTNHVTCLDGLRVQGRSFMEKLLEDLISRAKASLAVLAAVSVSNEEEMPQPLKGNLPSWVTLMDRRLLESGAKDIKADVVVAKDGSGNYSTVTEAVESAPNKSMSRYVIYVKRGTYKENVEVGKKKWNVTIIGDGMNLTVITGSLNYVDTNSTFRSATLAAVGDGFRLQDICVKNTAGPEKHQAAALRVGADKSVINRCLIDAYQDTLYAHSLRQFYRDCNITGTVDFIFGNAAVVLQNCKIIARKPMTAQKNMVTAQGRTDPNQSTGTSIQNCDIIASSDLAPVQDSFKTYLGRPWKNFSRTVVMQSYIGDLVDPAGWSEWNGDMHLETLYYGEYMNEGPGAGTSKRVKWPGFHVITNASVAKDFTVGELIQGGTWLKSTGVAFTEGL